MTQKTPLSLRSWLAFSLIVTLVCPLVVFGLVYTAGMVNVVEEVVLTSLKERGRLQAHALARQIYLPWHGISRFADTIRMDDPIGLQEVLTRIVEADQRFVWLGVARTDGTVYAASSGVREGQRVSGHPWFESGLHGPFASAHHRDPGIAAMMPRGTPVKRILHFSAPVRDSDGHIVGVLGARFDWDEVRSVLAGFGGEDAQTLLVGGNHQVLFGPEDLEGQHLHLSSVTPRSRLEPTARIETWPDGNSYVTVIVPRIEYHDLPGFGWRLVVRQDPGAALQPLQWLIRHFWIALGIGLAATLCIMLLIAQGVSAPVRRLADFCNGLALGDVSEPPPEERAYREVHTLSAALTRLQTHMILIDGDGWSQTAPAPEYALPSDTPNTSNRMSTIA